MLDYRCNLSQAGDQEQCLTKKAKTSWPVYKQSSHLPRARAGLTDYEAMTLTLDSLVGSMLVM